MKKEMEWRVKVTDYNTSCDLWIWYSPTKDRGGFELTSEDSTNAGNGICVGGGLWFNSNELVDYDGVYEIPVSVLDSLESKGLNVTDIRESL